MATYNLNGYVGVRQVQNYTPSTPVFTAESLAQAAVTAAPEGEDGDLLGCNISFDLFGNISLNIPGADFFALYSVPNLTLFDKADQFSYEVAAINDILISAIEEMGCCDIARKYNTTMVPFFRFFADHPDTNDCGETVLPGDKCSYGTSDNFISTLIDIVKVITQVQAVIEPLLCLIRPLPGNPWLPFDFDFLSWAYAYERKAPMYLDKILSGEIIDIMLNPVANFRRKLEMCIEGTYDRERSFFDIKAVNDYAQLSRILNVATRDGGEVSAAKLIRPEAPKEPKAEAYPDQTSYQNALRIYESKKKAYDQKIITYNQMKAELNKTTQASKKLSQYEVDALNTKKLLNSGSNSGNLCNCVISALGLENLRPNWLEIHSKEDIYQLIGKELSITYEQVNINDRVHERTDKLVFDEKYINDETKLKRILTAATPSARYTDVVINQTTELVEHPYNDIKYYANIEVPLIEINTEAKTGTGWDIYKTNSDILKKISEISIQLERVKYQIQSAEKKDRADFNERKAQVDKALGELSSRISNGLYGTNTNYYAVSYDKAKKLYDNYFASWDSYDAGRDSQDWKSRSAYIDPDDADYEDDYVESEPVNFTDFTDGNIATEAKVDQRTGVIFYDNGLTLKNGDLSWRTNNPLLIEYDSWSQQNSAIGYYRTEEKFIAIYPNIEKGLEETKIWINAFYSDLSVYDFIVSFLKDRPYLIEKTVLEITRRINQNPDVILGNLSDNSLNEIIKGISLVSGYEPGEIWYNGKRLPIIPFVTPKVDTEIEINEKVYDNIVRFTQNQINAQVQNRGDYFSDIYSGANQITSLEKAIEDLKRIYSGNSAIRILYFEPIDIPCTCDGFVCALLQTIVSYILGLFNELLTYLANLIIDYLVPDFIRNMIRLVMEKVKCLVALFNIGETLDIINNAAESLLEDIRWRVQLYPDDACFIPDDLFGDPVEIGDPDDPGNPFTDPDIDPWKNPPGDNDIGDPWDDWIDDDGHNPRKTTDDPGTIIITEGGGSTITPDDNPIYIDVPRGDEKFPESSLNVELIITDGVKVSDVKLPENNIPELYFDCGLSKATTSFTACNQTRTSQITIP